MGPGSALALLACPGRQKAISRRDFARAIINSSPHPRSRGRRECRVRAAPAVSCAKDCAIGAHEHTGQRRTLRHPLRNGFTAYNALSPVSGLVVTVALEKLASKELSASIAAPGPHDFAVRSRTIRLWTAASIASRAQRVVTMAIRPSGERETVSYIVLICRNCKRKIYAPSWTTQSA